ncbi:phage baseplate assembly protein V [Sphingomonas jatrophae]|uniref:Phage baseplate assembly protein V n=1 Tax=Sphingomonas jatrophae TaxID=1166337 RepID=A0A1I6JLE9_9SPHN|nr:phage baseplate assembly protein V [Sphingomonas jatrophae]SFR79764.1 phage baseplate assembly protein V [Sphingomonas jatrophae]
MSDPADLQRLIGDICRLGTVASIDLAAGTCCVKIGDILTNDLPWAAARAGAIRAWLPPSVGEQVIVFSPEGDTEAGIVLGGIFSDARPAPASEAIALLLFDDGASISYDPAGHRLDVTLPAGATATIAAPGGITLDGPVHITGALTTDDKATFAGDVKGAGISLKDHVHGQVQAGSAKSGKPE